MDQNRITFQRKHHRGLWTGLMVILLILLILPTSFIMAEESDPPDVHRGLELRYPTEEDNRDLTRGMMYVGGLMVLIVVAGTLRVLRLDRINRPHLLRPRQKRELPDATVKKSAPKSSETESTEEQP